MNATRHRHLGKASLLWHILAKIEYSHIMELITNEAFLAWAETQGIGLAPEEPKPLLFIPERGDSRFWETPMDDDQCLSLFILMLDAFDDWQSMWAYKRGVWTFEWDERPAASEQSLEAASRWTGIPAGYLGSIRYDQSDRANLIFLLMLLDKRGPRAHSDIFLVPDHGQQMLWLNHSYAIFVFFAAPSKAESFTERMESLGYLLPTDPSEDFLWGQWLGATPDGWKYIWENPSWR